MTNTISMKQVKNLLNYTIDNNLKLEEEGKVPIAIGLEASAGIGKTSIVEQVAKERGMNYAKISLHELEETGDLVGFPLKEYECQVFTRKKKDDGTYAVSVSPSTIWLNDKQIDGNTNPNIRYQQTGKTRMGYAKPAWVPEYNENGTICLLDDYVRANQQLLQSCMELILTQKYVSWSLPKKTTIVLTNNPDDGTSNVNSLDEAQRTRFLNYEVEFSLDPWMEWAERAKLDGRCINFVASYFGELFNKDDQGNSICNPRSFVMFANMISGIKDWDNAENLSFIQTIATGCFKDQGNRFAQMFGTFIRHKMHLLIQPKEMLEGGWDTVKTKLEGLMYDQDGKPRPDISSLLERRFANYVNAWLDSNEPHPIAKVKDRILNFMENEEKGGKKLFTNDLYIHMLQSITSDHKNQTNHLLYEPKIAKLLTNGC